MDLGVDGIGSLTNNQSVELIAALLMVAWTALLVSTSAELIVNSVLSMMLRLAAILLSGLTLLATTSASLGVDSVLSTTLR